MELQDYKFRLEFDATMQPRGEYTCTSNNEICVRFGKIGTAAPEWIIVEKHGPVLNPCLGFRHFRFFGGGLILAVFLIIN